MTSVDDHPRGSGLWVAERIKESILDGSFAPGQRLVEADLVRETGASRAHIREALRHLRAEGLVEIEPYRGAIVKRPSREDVYLAGRVREALEGLAARQLAERELTGVERDKLLELRAELTDAVASRDFDRYVAANETLHRFIIEASGNPYLLTFLDRLRLVVRQTRHMALFETDTLLAGNVEHLAIIDAILLRHPDVAESMMRMHVHKGTQMIDASVSRR